MMKKRSRLLFLVFFFFFVNYTLRAQETKTRILFLLDGSGSMWAMWEKEQRIIAAKRLLTSLVDSLADVEGVELAFRAFGHRSHKVHRDCKDTRLEVPFGLNNKDQIIEKINDIVPKGTTPIAYSLSMAATDFPRSKDVRNIIILITDGIEECDGDPCAVSLELQKRGIILKPFIIGIGIDENFYDHLDCIGNFFNAKNEEAFVDIMNVVISNALNSTTAQVNLLDMYGKPTETDVNMTFYDNHSGIIRQNFYHVLNHKGNPDTLMLDPVYKYDLQIHTIPPIDKVNIELNPGKHNIIPVDAAQGFLELKVSGLTSYANLQALVYKQDGSEILHLQDFNTSEKYLVGIYKLVVLTIPRTIIENVEIKQSQTTTVQIPQPGKLTIYSAQNITGSIYQHKDKRIQWVCNINPNIRNQSIIMQPGVYIFSYKRNGATQTNYTNHFEFKITSGTGQNINLR
jgi:Ca-activated chloride channel homolog